MSHSIIPADPETPCAIVYHYPCPDGAYAAFAAWLALSTPPPAGRATPPPQQRPLTWLPCTITEPLAARIARVVPLIPAGAVVYIVDFTGGVPFIEALSRVASTVHVFDHHKTGKEDCVGLPPNVHAIFDMTRSGATISRDAFGVDAALLSARCGGPGGGASVGQAFGYVEDVDLWKHALPSSKAWAAGLSHMDLEFDVNKNPSLFHTLCATWPSTVITSGTGVLAKQEAIIAAELSGRRRLAIPHEGGAFHCLVVETKHPQLRSEAGNQLAVLASGDPTLQPAGAIVYPEVGLIKVSLRSLGVCDTTAVARAFGGGGHANASSFSVAEDVYRSWQCV